MRILLLAIAITLSVGCSTMMTDRMVDVRVTSEPSGVSYNITDQMGQRVANGITPSSVTLDASAGGFDGQTYQVAYSTGETIELDSHTTGWFWWGLFMEPISGLIVDSSTGDMWTLPNSVANR